MSKMIKVGWHGWHPTLDGIYDSPDPNGVWMDPLAGYLKNYGINSWWLGKTHEISHTSNFAYKEGVKNLDLVIFNWRWLLPDNMKYADRNQAYYDQMMLIDQCEKYKVPFFVHNQDYMMSQEIMLSLAETGLCSLMAPAVHPPHMHKTLHYPMFMELQDFAAHRRGEWITYIGNNYERMDMAVKYLAFKEEKPEVLMYGNWLSPTNGDGRPDPAVVLEAFPEVRFKGKCSQLKVIENLMMAKATLHMGKPQYCSTSLIALRWLEAAAAGTPALIPAEYSIANDFPGRVANQRDVLNMMEHLRSASFFKAMIRQQRNAIAQICDPKQWVDRIVERVG